MDIEQLTDSELASMLKQRGVDVGPIMETTRRVYERKLQRLLDAGDSGDGMADPDAYADTVPVEEVTEPTYRQTRSSPQRPQAPPSPARQQAPPSPARPQRRTSPVRPQSSAPVTRSSPQRPAAAARYERGDVSESRTYESSMNESTLTRRSLRPTSVTATGRSAIRPTTNTEKVKSSKKGMSVCVQLLILVVVGVVIFLVIQNMEPAAKSPVNSIN